MPNCHILIKPASGLCNIRCKYCFYEDETQNREVESYGMMTEETLRCVIQKTLDFTETECTIAYQGGEPTLQNLSFFKKAVEFQREYNKKNCKIHNAIQTNGIAVTDEMLDFWKENGFLVGISLDGIAFTHDCNRIDTCGDGTFEVVMSTIARMKEREIDFNILTVVNAQTAKKAEAIYNFYKQNGFAYQQYIACLNPIGEHESRYPHTLTSKAYGQFLKALFDCWYQDMKKGEVVHIQQFEEYINLLLGYPPGLCGMSGVCSSQNVIEADGEVYPCDFYVLDAYKLGNLTQVSFVEIQDRRKEIAFIEESRHYPKVCEECTYFYICRGGCRRNREPKVEDVYGKNIFCEAYESFFTYAIERLREIASWYARGR